MKLRIKEAMDSSIPSWLRAKLTKKVAPNQLRDKVDIANTVYHPMSIPRTAQEFNKIRKDPNQVTVVRLKDDRDHEFVWLVGYNDGSYFAPSGTYSDDKPISRHAAKNLLSHIVDYGYLDIAPQELADIRKSRRGKPLDRRKTAQYLNVSHQPDYDFGYDEEGNWGRIYQQGPAMQTWKTVSGYDKSGYKITGIEKYKEMLASIGFRNYDAVMDKAYDAYTALTGLVRLCRGSKYKFKSYKTLVERFMRYLSEIEEQYMDYTDHSNDDSDYAYSDRYKERYIRPRIEQSMKQLRTTTKAADEFVKHVTDDDWTEEDYSDFEWRL